MGEKSERRGRSRVNYAASVVIRPNGYDFEICGQSTDISMNGLHAVSKCDVPNGTNCEVLMFLQGKNSLLTMEIGGEVTRCADDGIAVRFDDDLEWWAIFTIYSQFSGQFSPVSH